MGLPCIPACLLTFVVVILQTSQSYSRHTTISEVTLRQVITLTVLALISPSSLSISLHYPISRYLSPRAELSLASPTPLSLVSVCMCMYRPGMAFVVVCVDVCWSCCHVSVSWQQSFSPFVDYSHMLNCVSLEWLKQQISPILTRWEAVV